MRSPGFVYVMVNPRAPQFVRVGKTDHPPEDAAREANLQLRDAGYFSDCLTAEGFCHDYLRTFNTGNDPEMFEVPIEIALKALSLAMEKHVGTRANIPVNSSLYDEEPQVNDGTTAATLYEEGARRRQEQNPQEAMRYFKRAARLSEPRAFISLAEMQERGEGCSADANRGVEWLHEGTRAGVRECWGALADRMPQTKYLRPYFTGLDVHGLNPEQRNNTVRRMRMYFQLAANGLTPEDLNAIEGVMAELGERDLQRQWKQCQTGTKRSGGGSILKWGLALTIAGAVGIVVPFVFLRGNTEQANAAATPAAANAAPEPESVTPASGTTPAARTKSAAGAARQKASTSNTPQAAVTTAAAPRPVIHDPSAVVEAPPAAKVEAPVIRTAPVAEAATAREISALELQEHFSYDKGKATAAFKDSMVKITEPVEKVGKHDLSFKKIKCKFDGAPPDRISAGMTVTVEGIVHGKGNWTGTITLEHCRVL